eukprot:7395471-Pyramimonas_sp.AAC.1
MAVEPHANFSTEAFGGTPYGATNRMRGGPKWRWNRRRALPLGPSVEPLCGHEPYEGWTKMAVEPHANFATGAFGGAPYGATNRVR